MTYINHIDTVKTGRIRMLADNHGNRKLLGFYSSFADAELKGRLSYNKMFSYFKNTLISYLPSISEHDGQERETIPPADGASSIDNYYLLNVNVKEANNVAGIFIPGLQVAQGTTLAFLFNPESDVFSLTLNSELIENEQFFVSNLKASAVTGRLDLDVRNGERPAGQKPVHAQLFGHRRGQREPGQPGHAVQQHRKRHLRDAQHHFRAVGQSGNGRSADQNQLLSFHAHDRQPDLANRRRQIVYDSTRVVVDQLPDRKRPATPLGQRHGLPQ